MPDIARLYNFLAGTVIDPEEVDDELNQIIAAINALDSSNIGTALNEGALKPQNGLVVGTQNVTLDGPTDSAWADWSSGSVTFTPAANVYLIAMLEAHGQLAQGDAGTNIVLDFSIAIDGGAEETRFAKLSNDRNDESHYQHASMLYRIALTGGVAHTVKIRRRKTTLPAGVGKASGVGAELLWLLVAQ